MRFLLISWILSKYLLFYKFTVNERDNFGKRMKLAFEELGITFIKIGQILSMRYDILQAQDCAELQQLLDNVRPIPLETIHTILQQEYGKEQELVFRKFDSQPLGSASVSQVHKAETFDGKTVAVKIKRPNVDQSFAKDMAILKSIASMAEFFSITLKHVQLKALVNYFESWIKQDMDFVGEVRNMQLCKQQYSFSQAGFRKDLGQVIIPSPVETLCTKNIVVMDYIDGIPLSRTRELIDNKGYDIQKSVKTFVVASIRNWFQHDRQVYLFQADPHLSNILALPGGGVASIDYGLISSLTRQEAQQAKDLIIAVYLQDLNRTLRVGCQMTGVSYEKYAPILKPEIEVYLMKTRGEGFGFWFLEFAKIMIKNRIKFPLYLTTFGRTNVMLDGLVKTYFPHHTTLDLLEEELQSVALREMWCNITGINWLRVGYSLSEKLKQAPEIVGDIVDNPLKFVSDIAKAVKTSA